MEITDFASKVEKAYNDGKNIPSFNEAARYMQDVVKKYELKKIELANRKEETKSVKENKKLEQEQDYEK